MPATAETPTKDLNLVIDARRSQMKLGSDFPEIQRRVFERGAKLGCFSLPTWITRGKTVYKHTAEDLAWLIEEASDRTWQMLDSCISYGGDTYQAWVGVLYHLAKEHEGDMLTLWDQWDNVPINTFTFKWYLDRLNRTRNLTSTTHVIKTHVSPDHLLTVVKGYYDKSIPLVFNFGLNPIDKDILDPLQTEETVVTALDTETLMAELKGRALGGAAPLVPFRSKNNIWRGNKTGCQILNEDQPGFGLRIADRETNRPLAYKFLDHFYTRFHTMTVDRHPLARHQVRKASGLIGYHLRNQIGSLVQELTQS